MKKRDVTIHQDQSPPPAGQDSAARSQRRQPITPAVDVLENEVEYLVYVDLPGAGPSDVRIELESGELLLRAPRPALGPTVDILSGQRTTFEYVRRFRLPGGIASNAVSAELSEGTLCLRLPKEETHRPRQIPVTSG